ncbi:MAG: hypothetical protein MR852_03910 [Treponema sp.]|nr:hypothetical protein [Treponema sp.]
MMKRTLFSNAVCLTLRNKQLLIQNKETHEESSVPVVDIGFVIIENNQVYVFVPFINALADGSKSDYENTLIEGGITKPSKRRSQGFKRTRALTRRIMMPLWRQTYIISRIISV